MEHGTWNILYFGMCVFLFACFEQQHTKQTHWNSMAICILCARHRIIRKKAVFMTISSNSEMLDVASAPECTVPAFVMLRDCNYLNKQPNSITERKAKRKETLLFLCLLPPPSHTSVRPEAPVVIIAYIIYYAMCNNINAIFIQLCVLCAVSAYIFMCTLSVIGMQPQQ